MKTTQFIIWSSWETIKQNKWIFNDELKSFLYSYDLWVMTNARLLLSMYYDILHTRLSIWFLYSNNISFLPILIGTTRLVFGLHCVECMS